MAGGDQSWWGPWWDSVKPKGPHCSCQCQPCTFGGGLFQSLEPSDLLAIHKAVAASRVNGTMTLSTNYDVVYSPPGKGSAPW